MDVVERLLDRIKVCIWASTCVGVMFGLLIAHDLYLFGATDFVEGDPLQVKVQKLASVKTQLSYFYYSLPYCMPKEIVDHLSLEEIVQKDLIENSPYQFKMLELQMCRVVCRTTLNDNDAKVLKEATDGEYRVNMILDDLPLVMLYNRSDMDSFVYQQGSKYFLVGAIFQRYVKMHIFGQIRCIQHRGRQKLEHRWVQVMLPGISEVLPPE